jgi:hypothetical protein
MDYTKMRAPPSNKTAVQRFADKFDMTLADISEIVLNLHEDGLCQITKGAVDVARLLIKGFEPQLIIKSFAEVHAHWSKVKSCSTEFVTKDLAEIVKQNGITVDTGILSIALICHEKIKSSPEWTNVAEDDLPVNQKDIDRIWGHFHSLIRTTCSWIHEGRQPLTCSDGRIVYENPSFYQDVDLDVYQKMFEFKL